MIGFIIFMLKKMNVFTDGDNVHHLNREPLNAQSMVRLKNPFMFKLKDESIQTDNYRNGLKVDITCDSSFWVMSFWAVTINDLHQSLDTDDWQPMRQQLLDEKFIDGHYLYKSEPELYYETNETVTHWIKPPDVYFSGESLGYNPRSRYPLVVLIIRNDDDDGVEIDDNDVVCLISIIHLRDSFCTSTTSLITQYLKQRNGSIFDLKQLFAPQSEFESHTQQLCVICQSSLVSVALLPCRHSCLCGQCFQRVDNCPICRLSITSFFRIRDDDDGGDVGDDTEDNPDFGTNQRQTTGWFASINNKINQWLGLN
ncbi:cell growth regulator with RING finger domain protein 1-like [Oppia nitens]|uniref:cell growth regulator with RING finger domain protein 1-like n=1 Tax=Oppia nitens TaxID=1686743 RepID=UPI0023DB7D02|nr:cell growth regulator with RING finger domain protein 1-like [Oppia nitens]